MCAELGIEEAVIILKIGSSATVKFAMRVKK
jgi:hypothetical protein